jgi:alanyl-tRNA synthetase
MDSNHIRARFVRFFEARGHLPVTSASLVVQGDPSVLLTSAGMQQFKPFYLDPTRAPSRRAVSIQKCMRTSDIEEVGDTTHHTFFEMLGNFAFGATHGGGYFKREAITYAYQFVLQELGLPIERVWATTWSGEPGIPPDSEAVELWQAVGMPLARIRGLNRKPDGSRENFWGPTGDSGPCGPCSELHIDTLGACPAGAPDADCGPGHECGRFVEIWNLVFNQFYQDVDKSLRPLEHTGVDTGAGLERIAAYLQKAPSAYETDLFRPIVAAAEAALGVTYGATAETDRSLRIVADHVRSVTFMVADGVFPSNEARGYVARRLLRRAVRHGRLLGHVGPFLGTLVDATINRFGEMYPNLVERGATVRQVVTQEEERFSSTLLAGIELLDAELARLTPGAKISGAAAFRLYDTYGFPLELTREVAGGRGVEIDEEAFTAELEAGRARSRASARFTRLAELDLPAIETAFDGYESLDIAVAQVVAVRAGGERALTVSAVADDEGATDDVWVILDRTPFYAERGGQVGDRGTLIGPTGTFAVATTQAPQGTAAVVHVGRVTAGTIAQGDLVRAVVDEASRVGTMAHHTATHLLHAALRAELGEHVHQSGSLVAPDRLRFDFAHGQPLTSAERRAVQSRVNAAIRADLPVDIAQMPTAEALKLGAMALFDETYGDVARVVTVPTPGPLLGPELHGDEALSRELCGGTHARRTGSVGPFVIVSEGSSGSGIRRIEALAGLAAEAWLDHRAQMFEAVAGRLGTTAEALPARVEAVLADLAEVRRRLEAAERRAAQSALGAALSSAINDGEASFVFAEVSAEVGPTFERLREASDWVRDKLGTPSVIVLASVVDGRVQVTAAVSSEVSAVIGAGKVLGEVVAELGGRGGGRPEMAQGGGGDPSRLGAALVRGLRFAREALVRVRAPTRAVPAQ